MSEVRLPSPVKAQYFVDLPDEGHAPAGAYTFYVDQSGDIKGMIYCCPCGCGRHGSLAFRPHTGQGSSWEWDGNIKSPTLGPSVHHVGHWHGYLRSGQWVDA